jgi:hypothetical protein
MELEFFCKPGTDLEWFEYWKTFCKNWLMNLGIKEENLRLARNYWNNGPNSVGEEPVYETLVDGEMKVIEIVKENPKLMK